jgi:tRNA-2-methylthio-N6-dimethylallyladenosine synthase
MNKLKTYNIITIGCQMNKSDSERVAGYLEEYGLESTNDRKKADVVIINTCGVRQSAEDRIYGLVPRIKKDNKLAKIIITGCLVLRDDVRSRLYDNVDIWLPIVDLPKLATQLKLPSKTMGSCNYLNIKPAYDSKISAFVPIGNGCNNFCAYCVVPYARGREIYRPAEEIIAEVESLVKNGYKEITLIAQNVNSYEVDMPAQTGSRKAKVKSQVKKLANPKINFSTLLKTVDDIPGEFWIRFATSHPKDMSNELIQTIAECNKVCRHIHLPAQAGDSRVIKAMNRHYTREHYLGLIKKIKQAMPDASLTTDIIVGFPGETKKEFNNTAKLFKEVNFDMAYIAQYSPRPGTAAAKLADDVSKAEKKNREGALMVILRKTALSNNKKLLGQIIEVLIAGKGKDGKYFGYTRTSKNVKINSCNMEHVTRNIKKDDDLLGRFVKVKIVKAQDFGLEGDMVEERKKKVIVIVGTTASGKTKLGVEMALKYNGEIVSADSRQVYRGMDVGTGKDLREYKAKLKVESGKLKEIVVPYHLIDVADPKDKFDLAQWYKMAKQAIDDIIARNKLPIVVGGTGLYAQALVDGYNLTEIKPDKKLRDKLEKKNREDLFKMLADLNSAFANKLNNSEKNNKRRLIRYIEILSKGQKQEVVKKKNDEYDFEIIGVTYPKEELRERIYQRLIERLEKEDMIGEVRGLHKQGLGWERLESFGLEYKFIAQYLQDKLDYEEMVNKIYVASCQYAKRQMTWLKRWEKQRAKIQWKNIM